MSGRRRRCCARILLKVTFFFSASCFSAIWFSAIGAASHVFALPSILDTNGFEGYSLSSPQLKGQIQNVAQNEDREWLRAGDQVSTAVVQTSVVQSGAKAVQVTKGSYSDDRWAVRVGDFGFPTYRYVTVDWDMLVASTGATGGIFGPFFGVDTYDDTINPRVLGSLGLDATTGEVLYQFEGTGVLTVAGAPLSFSQWHHYQIRLDFAQDQYQIFVNGTQRASTGFVDGPSDHFTDADIATFAAQFDGASQSQSGTAYFDNFLVKEYIAGDFDVDGDVDGGDLALWKSSYSVNAIGDADFDGDTDGDDFLIWQQNLSFPGGNLPGDFDHDGDVDGTDLTFWQSAYGSTDIGDADFDGDSDGADFMIWQRNYGLSTSGEVVASAIPEPSSLLLAIMLLGTLRGRR